MTVKTDRPKLNWYKSAVLGSYKAGRNTLEKIEALLPWNVPMEHVEKKIGINLKGTSRSI